MLTDDGSVDDVRLTMFDVIPSREDVSVSRVAAENFGTSLASPLGFSIARGYVVVDAKVSGSSYRFVNTHLEAYSEDVRKAEADELITALEGESLPLIVSGDFNSDADALPGDPSRTVYDLIEAPSHRPCLHQEYRCVLHRVGQHGGDRSSDRVPAGVWPSDRRGGPVHCNPLASLPREVSHCGRTIRFIVLGRQATPGPVDFAPFSGMVGKEGA